VCAEEVPHGQVPCFFLTARRANVDVE
jgi:hypothetical protein